MLQPSSAPFSELRYDEFQFIPATATASSHARSSSPKHWRSRSRACGLCVCDIMDRLGLLNMHLSHFCLLNRFIQKIGQISTGDFPHLKIMAQCGAAAPLI